MPLDYGSVRDYSDRGFGFVSCTFRETDYANATVFFHIKTVRRKYPQLADSIDQGSYSEVSFWYETSSTDRGYQVAELWLTYEELPERVRTVTREKITRILLEARGNLSSAFEKLAQQALGQREYDRARLERERHLQEMREAEATRQRLAQEEQRRAAERRVTVPSPAPPVPVSVAQLLSAEPSQVGVPANWWYEQLKAMGGGQLRAATDTSHQIETKVVGVTYEGRQKVVSQLSLGEQVSLRREPNNPYDRYAISVDRGNGQQIGYISKGEAAMWAPLLDARGGVLPATVTFLVGGSSDLSYLGVRIRFILPEAATVAAPAVRDFDECWER